MILVLDFNLWYSKLNSQYYFQGATISMEYGELEESFNPINPDYRDQQYERSEHVQREEPQISAEDLVLYMKEQLRVYDKLERDGQVTSETSSPYSDPWVYGNIQVPQQLQKIAITEWLEDKKILDQHRQPSHNHVTKSVAKHSTKHPTKHPTTLHDNWIENKLIWFVLGLVVMYIIVKNRIISI